MKDSKPLKPDELERRLDQVRRGLFRRRCLRAFLVFGVGSLAATALCVAWMHVRGDQPRDWLLGLIAFLVVEVAMGAALLVNAWRSNPSPRQIALFVDEHHPELENLVLSATDASRADDREISAWMIERLRSDPRLRADRLALGSLIPRALGWKFLAAGLAMLLLWAAILLAGRSLWFPKFEVAGLLDPTVRRALVVEPGDARVRRGQNQVVVAKVNRAGPSAVLRWRSGGGDWRETAMTPGKSPELHYHPFESVDESIQYEVAWNGLRSPRFELAVWEPPQVESIDLTYRYPDYLDMPSRTVPGGGNIAGVEGTRVEIRLAANKPLERAALVFKSGEKLSLERDGDLGWRGTLELTSDDEYHVELRDNEDELNPLTRRYQVTVKPDQPPKISVKHPRGDSDATLLDEVPFEFEVEDDFGLADYGLQYQVGEAEPTRISLKRTEGGVQAVARHALALEEMNLETGDLVTWSAWAEDRRPGRESYEGFGDLYFLQVRPFAQRFVEAPSQQGGAGMGGGNGQPLAELQKEVLIATWNLRSGLASMSVKDYDAGRATILEMELRILQRVEEAKQRASSKEAKELLRKLGTALSSAIHALEQARGADAAHQLTEAERHERTAYELLLSDAAGEIQVSQVKSLSARQRRNNPQGLNELELDRNRNFYEEENRTQPEDPEADEALERLRELSARQALINEEIAKLISELSQAKTKEEMEEIQRRLERLKEEIRQNLEQLDELEQQLQDTQMSSREMSEATERIDEARRQNAASLETLEQELSESAESAEDASRLQQARSAGRRALDSLSSLEQDLTERSRQSVEERLEALVERFRAFTSESRDLVGRLEELQSESEGPGLRAPKPETEEKSQLLLQAGDLADEFVAMMESAGRVSEDAAQSQPLVSRELGDWLRETSAAGIAEDLESTRESLDYALWDAAEQSGAKAAEKLIAAEQQLEAVLESIVEDESDANRIALENLQELLKAAGLPVDEMRSGQAAAGDGQTTGGLAQSGERGRRGSGPGDADGDRTRAGDTATHRDDADAGADGENGEPAERRGAGRSPDEFEIAWDAGEDSLGVGADARREGDGVDREREGAEAGGSDGEAAETGEGDKRSDQAAARGGEPSPGARTEAGQNGDSDRRGQAGEREGDPGWTGHSTREGTKMIERGYFPEGVGEQAASGATEAPGDRPVGISREQLERMDGQPGSGGSGSFRINEFQDWPVEPESLFRENYRAWTDGLRRAQTALGGADAVTKELDRIALQMERLRREMRRTGHPPRFDLFLEAVAMPLEEVTQELALRLQRAAREGDLMLPESEEIPAQYQKLVADYFESLSAGAAPARP